MVAKIWAVLNTSDSVCLWVDVAADLQDSIDLADELHANGQGGFGDRAAKLFPGQ